MERRLKVTEKFCKTALSKTGVSSYDYTINPYTGCQNACVYCLDGDTSILMSDGTSRPIRDVRIGDEVVGVRRIRGRRSHSYIFVKTRVLNHWRVVRPAIELTLENGTKIVCSGEHRWLTERGWKYAVGEMQGLGRRPYLTKSNFLRGFGYTVRTPEQSTEYKKGYLAAVIRGDALLGHYDYSYQRRKRRDEQHQFRLAMKDTAAVRRVYEYLLSFGIKTSWFKFRLSASSQYVDAIRSSQRELCERLEALITFDTNPEWLRGWMAGIFDAEGSGTSGEHRATIRISNKDEQILKTTRQALEYYGFKFKREDYPGRPTSAIRVKGGTAEYMRFFELIGTAIPRKIVLEGMAVKGRFRIVSIVKLGEEREMYDITTGTGDFIANGLVSHNCYANFMRRFSGHLQDAWGSFVDVKVNLLDVLGKELPRRAGGRIWLSSVCDPYQSLEGKYQLSRRVIELVSRHSKFSISILTKNALVLRDLDLLEHMKDRVDVGFTITTFSPDAQPVFEPYASRVTDRIKALRRLNEAGIDTWVFVAPILPYATEEGLEQGLQRLAEAGVKRLMTDRYNARGMIIRQTLQAYGRWRPSIDLEKVRDLMWYGKEYYRQLDGKIANSWKRVAPGSIHEAAF